MKTRTKIALWGFLFGTVGLYVLAAGSLFSSVVETISSPLFWPGRTLSSWLIENQGSDLAVGVLTLANGILYSAVFVAINKLLRNKGV